MGAELVGVYLACLLAVSMELLVIWDALWQRIDWGWVATSTLVAVPLAYVVLPPTLAANVVSGARDNLGLWVSWTQIVAQIAIVVAGVIAFFTLRAQRSGWRTTTLWGFLQEWEGSRMSKDRARTAKVLLEERRTGTRIALDEYIRVLNFFEVLGLLVRQKAFTADDAWVWFSDYAKVYWEACEWRIEEARKDDITVHEEFKFLIHKFERIDQIKNVKPFGDSGLVERLEYEATLDPGPIRVRVV